MLKVLTQSVIFVLFSGSTSFGENPKLDSVLACIARGEKIENVAREKVKAALNELYILKDREFKERHEELKPLFVSIAMITIAVSAEVSDSFSEICLK